MRALALIVCVCLVGQISAIRFFITQNSKRCLKEELHKDVVVTGDYEVADPTGHRIDLQVTDSKGQTALMRENIDKGKIAITPDEDDIYDFCFISFVQANHPNIQKEIHIDLKHGVEAKNYDEIAHVQKLKPMEMDLTKLEDLSASIVQDFEYMRKREQEMRDTNESTNSRVFYLGMFSMLCLFSLATWQVLYLRQFFKTKKLI